MENEGFSGVVRLTNISDFIAPNLNCIIPLETTKTAAPTEEPLVGIRIKDATIDKPKEKKNVVKISLNDCLACNGCITSAETVLVEEQSLARVLEAVKNFQFCVATISPQTVCSIAAKRQLHPSEAAKLISTYFLNLGFKYVLDSSFGRMFSLEAQKEEFLSSSIRPMLSSACPGFVCYAEKTHGPLLTPLISKVRSPQAIQGALVKDFLARRLNLNSEHVYHLSVMPCFDKKLEASRTDFYVPGTSLRETDCVLSTAELESALPATYEPVNMSHEGWLSAFSLGHVIGGTGGTSGGYAELIAQSLLSLHGGTVNSSRVAKNLDVIEIVSEHRTFRIAQCYGFRNIQNVVRKMKSGKCTYDFIEVMACPNGCANGGGQVRAETTAERESLLKKVEEIYGSLQDEMQLEFKRVFDEWSQLNPNFKQLIYTDYHIIDTNISQKLDW